MNYIKKFKYLKEKVIYSSLTQFKIAKNWA